MNNNAAKQLSPFSETTQPEADSSISTIPVELRKCFNWLSYYRYALFLHQALTQNCIAKLCWDGSELSLSPQLQLDTQKRVPNSCVRVVAMDAILDINNNCGYISRQFKDQLLPFSGGAKFYPLTQEIALIVAKDPNCTQLLNCVVPYMTPASATLQALLAVAGGFAGQKNLEHAHFERQTAADELRQDLASIYGLKSIDNVRVHLAAVGGIIEACTRFLNSTKPGFSSCVLTPEYWDLLRLLITYSPKGMRLVSGRESESFPAKKWLSTIAGKDLDFAYISLTSNPLGSAISKQILQESLESISDQTLFMIDCTSVETNNHSSHEYISSLLSQFSHKNIVITKSFSKEYELAHLRIGYALFSKREMAEKLWPYMSGYPAAHTSRTARNCLRLGNSSIIKSYADANKRLFELASKHPEIKVTGGFSNYTLVFFESEDKASKMLDKLAKNYGDLIYPGEIPMQGGGDIGLNEGEINLTTMKRIPFLATNAIRLMVTPQSVEDFFKALDQDN